MFQFPPCAARRYGFTPRRFGDPGVSARLTARPGLSQSSTPFVACRRQDIPHTPLVAWPHRRRPRGGEPGGKPRARAAAWGRGTGGVTILLSLGLMQRLERNASAAASPRKGAVPRRCALVRQLLPLPTCQRAKRLAATAPEGLGSRPHHSVRCGGLEKGSPPSS